MRQFVFDPSWRVIHEGDLLLVTAGADEIFAIEDVPADVAAEVVALANRPAFALDECSEGARAIVDQLLTAGIIRIAGPVSVRSVALRWIGSVNHALERRLEDGLRRRGVEISDVAEFLIFVRTNGRLRDMLEDDYHRLTVPHLLIDLAYHHTCSVGPVVYPGDTACLGCLAGRLSTYWGDAPPPATPRMTSEIDLVAGVAALEIERTLDGDDSLTNATVAYDFGQRAVTRRRLFKLPWCQVCGTGAADSGAIHLPWTEERCSGS
jgi:bacteriocin biosynthesis cyclodehydratase domain-containing protein